jgi:hypothetical protein
MLRGFASLPPQFLQNAHKNPPDQIQADLIRLLTSGHSAFTKFSAAEFRQ